MPIQITTISIMAKIIVPQIKVNSALVLLKIVPKNWAVYGANNVPMLATVITTEVEKGT